MKDAFEIVHDYRVQHNVDRDAFIEWLHDCGYTDEQGNIHDSQFLAILETFVMERDENPSY